MYTKSRFCQYVAHIKGIAVCKIFIRGGISSNIQSEILFYGIASENFEYSYLHSYVFFSNYTSETRYLPQNVGCLSDIKPLC